ncbi:MAG TPA: glycosyltransferase family 39 protein, partial [Chloroflexota bacterium]|nr:glycosyltransferase family 39 protein [Chloroflexota bacterium]
MTTEPMFKAKRESSTDLVAVAVLLLAFAVRVKGIRGIDLGLDGGLSVTLARMPLGDALTFLVHDVHPPLYYLGLRFWVLVAGTTPLAVKYLGLLLSTMAVAAAMGWIRSLVGSRGALLAGLTLAVTPATVEVGGSVREFGPAVTLMILAAWAYTRWSRQSRVAFVVLSALALWTSYIAVAVPLAAVIDAVARRSWRRLVVSALAGATILPWLGYIVSQGFLETLRSNGPRQNLVAPPPLLSQLGDVAVILTGGSYLTPTVLGPAVVGIVLIVLAVGLAVDRLSWRRPVPFVSGTGIFVGATIVASVILAIAVNTIWTRQAMSSRYVLPALPFTLLVVAAATQAASIRRPGLIVVAGIIPLVAVAGLLGWYARPT